MNKITVCLIGNRPKLFHKAISSLAQQTDKKFDLVVSDDSNSSDVEKAVKKTFPRAIYKGNKQTKGEIQNTNFAYSFAETEYICLFHDDDKLKTNFIQKVNDFIKSHTPDLLYTGRIIIDENDNEMYLQLSHKGDRIFKSHDVLDHLLFGKKLPEYKVPIMTPGMIFKKEILKTIGGLDETVDTHTDTDFILKSLVSSENIGFINEPIYYSRVWYGLSGRTKASERGEVFFSQLSLLKKFISFCQKKDYSKYLTKKDALLKYYGKDCVRLNGPMTWINLRYNGSYLGRNYHILKTAAHMAKLNKAVLILPKFYFYMFLNLVVPSGISRMIHRKMFKVLAQKI